MSEELLDKLVSWYEEDRHDKIAEAIEQLPESERGYELVSHYGRALNNLGRYTEALQQLLSVESQGRQDSVWHYRVGYAYFFMQQWEESLSAFEQADKLEPDDAATLEFIETCRNLMERQAEAVREINQVPFRERDFSRFWERSDYADDNYTEAPPTAEMIASVEDELGYKLPADYIWLMQQHNGGIPMDTCFPTALPTSWAEDHVAITGIMGIGCEKTYSLGGSLGSRFMLEEWGYPDIGVVLCDCPSAGHDVIMLDYRACGRDGEPAVVHVDQEAGYRITFLAPSFATFIVGLVNEEVFDTSEQDKLDALESQLGARSAEPVAEALKPFVWIEQDSGNVSVILNAGSYKQDLFATRSDEGFEGSGYDWGSLAAVFLEEKLPELEGIVRFDPEAGMFCAYSNQREALLRFAVGFKQACENDELIRDLFSRAILD